MMQCELTISLGQYSSAGPKECNQDFYGAVIPNKATLALRGIALSIADGISSSPVAHIASQTAVGSFLSDYYSTPDSWTVKKAASRVISATNAWLYSETKRSQEFDPDRGFVSTFSTLILKARQAHLFHIGDSRIYRIANDRLEQLTEDHRVILNSQQNYLGRALGMAPNIEIDYTKTSVSVGDIFLMTTDGVHEFIEAAIFKSLLFKHHDNLETAAKAIVEHAIDNGADDNLTIQIARIESLPDSNIQEIVSDIKLKPLRSIPEIGDIIDGWEITADINRSSRSHIFKAKEKKSNKIAALKVPSIDMREQETALQRMALEEWVAKRLTNQHLLRPVTTETPRSALYTTMEYVAGTSLTTWMADNPAPTLEKTTAIISQIATGLQAMHRKQILHQDLRPNNVMISENGHVTLIDYGAAKIAGIDEAFNYNMPVDTNERILGTFQFTAPEYFRGEDGTYQSDIYSLGVIAYQLLTGGLPYGSAMARSRSLNQQKKIKYIPAADISENVPDFVDAAIRKAVEPDPNNRYQEMSEFLADLRTPNLSLPHYGKRPLAEANSTLFWKLVSLALLVLLLLQHVLT
ncbi:bifunctional protein-serine/threonine kinase/phosphatase [Kordiimonas sp. SCSIO 12610]|uniref:bifunctional protein-serine/threonine kinase/phosphatase n=1 Tax=Kordiimonas sp. SCSIO 12610 TaxID=2829597 RepID=UPI00210C77EA|nr:bifunctional protein-serine/threonine kinase/phosphatase [Kordiimonas sp. SCSIO 12610]UTW55348.1 bifunctional protein-serine/threonine kinase/phosphatase [Kordiimonas sp. SCSIO 12610]